MNSEIVSVGTELLMGSIVDTNASYLAQQLAELGIDLYWVSQVGDNLGRATEVLSRAWQRSDLTVVTGGLGPTEDDLTREAIAAVLGEQPQVDPALAEIVRQVFDRRHVAMPQSNLKQAWLVPSAQSLANPMGTAPGWWVERDRRIIVALPGVPSEMIRIWETSVAPRLRRRRRSALIWSRTLKTLGLGESLIEEKIKDLLASANPTIATYAKADGIHIRLTAKASGATEAEAMIRDIETEIRSRLGRAIYGTDDQTLPGVVSELLNALDLSVATCEQVSAGDIASSLAEYLPSASLWKGGVVFPLDMGADPLGFGVGKLPYDNVPAVATSLARSTRERFGADVGLATYARLPNLDRIGTEIVQLHYAADLSDQASRGSRSWSGDLRQLKRMATLGTLDLLRHELLDRADCLIARA